MNNNFTPGTSQHKFLSILIIALLGPGIGLILWKLGLVLAPPWTFLTGMFYPLLACLGLPLVIIASALHWLGSRGVIAALVMAALAGISLLVIVGPSLPGGMTNCQPTAASAPSQLRYTCVSTSSDDTSYRYTFTLEGWAGWPIMHLVEPKP